VWVGEVRRDWAAALAGQQASGKAPNDLTLPGGLSARKVEVLRLVALGCSNRAIGEHLHISHNTVANHLRSILMKMGSANRAEAVAHAAHHDLLEADR
jgi:DNA-binding NarL/FixJ family response regulator